MPPPGVHHSQGPGGSRGSAVENAFRSWWVLLPLIPFGWLGWAGFLYAGMRARRRTWLAWAATYLVTGVAGLVLIGIHGTGDGI